MGKSAKVHKRISKKSKPSVSAAPSLGATSSIPVKASAQSQTQAAKKRATLKGKTTKRKSETGPTADGVLGGADYVSLMMGSRKKAKQEAEKLLRDNTAI